MFRPEPFEVYVILSDGSPLTFAIRPWNLDEVDDVDPYKEAEARLFEADDSRSVVFAQVLRKEDT